jgi:hypothetical protein
LYGDASQDLQAAIYDADAGSTLYICAGTHTSQSGEFFINKSLTLVGAGENNSGTLLNATVRIFDTTDPPGVSLSNLRISSESTGLVLVRSTVTMDSCTVSMSRRGISQTFGSLLMRGCSVRNNRGLQDEIGVGIESVNGSIELRNCLISRNTGASNGGGISTLTLPEESSTIILSQNTIVRSNGAWVGAGIFNNSGRTTVIISNDSAVCNSAPLSTQCDGIDQSRCFETCP